jgi:nicotinamidase-related amidase
LIDADPYPWPYDGDNDVARLALVISGSQPAWIERSVGAAAVAATIDLVAVAFRLAGASVVHVRHGVSAGGSVSAPRSPRLLPPVTGTPPWELASTVEAGDVVVDAGGVDGFFAGPLDRELRVRNVTHLVLVGFGAEAAVDSTLRSANDRGYECLTLTDAVAPFDLDTGTHALSSVTMSGGIFGAIATSTQLLSMLPSPKLLEAL